MHAPLPCRYEALLCIYAERGQRRSRTPCHALSCSTPPSTPQPASSFVVLMLRYVGSGPTLTLTHGRIESRDRGTRSWLRCCGRRYFTIDLEAFEGLLEFEEPRGRCSDMLRSSRDLSGPR